jgi:hypothetical protein
MALKGGVMPGWIVFLVYAAAFFFAVWLDYYFERVHWYWRVFALALAFAIGLTPPSPRLTGPEFDLAVGAAFTLLFTWGICEMFFRLFHIPHHAPHHAFSRHA